MNICVLFFFCHHRCLGLVLSRFQRVQFVHRSLNQGQRGPELMDILELPPLFTAFLGDGRSWLWKVLLHSNFCPYWVFQDSSQTCLHFSILRVIWCDFTDISWKWNNLKSLYTQFYAMEDSCTVLWHSHVEYHDSSLCSSAPAVWYLLQDFIWSYFLRAFEVRGRILITAQCNIRYFMVLSSTIPGSLNSIILRC